MARRRRDWQRETGEIERLFFSVFFIDFLVKSSHRLANSAVCLAFSLENGDRSFSLAAAAIETMTTTELACQCAGTRSVQRSGRHLVNAVDEKSCRLYSLFFFLFFLARDLIVFRLFSEAKFFERADDRDVVCWHRWRCLAKKDILFFFKAIQ